MYLGVLAQYMGVERLRFEELPMGLYRWVIVGYCPFYELASKSCRIHGEKPLACRMFPLLLNPSTLELLVSSACTWISENAYALQELGDYVEEIFPAEFSATRELVTILHAAETSNLVFSVFRGSPEVEKAFEGLRSNCNIIKYTTSSVVKGLGSLLVSECGKNEVKEVLSRRGVELLLVEEIHLKAHLGSK